MESSVELDEDKLAQEETQLQLSATDVWKAQRMARVYLTLWYAFLLIFFLA